MTTANLKPRVLVVDDSQTDREIISIVCNALGCSVELASDAFEALELFKERSHDLVLTDYMMEPENGIFLVSKIKELKPEAICMLLTGFPDQAVRRFAEEGQVFSVITKPIRAAELKESLRLALNQSKGATEKVSGIALSNRMDDCAALSGDSPETQALRDQITQSIKNQKPLLLTGLQGAGKSQIARFIHNNGPSAGKPLVEVSCSNMDEKSLRSDLIAEGGDWGSLLREAVGGTLLLGRILNLPLPVQKDFANQFDAISAEMHLIVLSDNSLEEALEQGRIDDDFYFKVTMEHIHVEPEPAD